MNKIKHLPEQVANQIAAGEVVERPSSIVKELVENAIDAGASRISIEIQQGGCFIRVVDNGFGISPDSLTLAFQRFATSKLTDYKDIWSLSTMGFRGEALPSIASIAKVTMVSRVAQNDLGKKLYICGGEIKEECDTGAPEGTSVTVEELFFNTPARLKFLRTENTELGYITQLITAFALGCPQISFKLTKNGKEVRYTNGNTTLIGVTRQLFGKEFAESLYTISHENETGKVTGALSYPHFVRRDRNRQFFFVNKRWVTVPGLAKLIDNIYENLVPKKNHPVVILNIDLNPDSVDVNVHPTKKEIKFRQFNRVCSLISQGIKEELAAYQMSEPRAYDPTPFSAGLPVMAHPSAYTPVTEEVKKETPPFEIQEAPILQSPTEQLELPTLAPILTPPEKKSGNQALKNITPIAQVCEKTYIVATYGSGLALIDQHIAHERHIYENLLAEGKALSQQVAISSVVELDVLDRGLLEENQHIFQQFGFEFEAFGPRAISIRAVPHFFRHIEEAEVAFKELLKDIRESGIAKSNLDRFNYLCKTVACHAAIRAGDPLTLEQMQELLQKWVNTQNPYTCPHGRPILIKFSKHELDKRFLRP